MSRVDLTAARRVSRPVTPLRDWRLQNHGCHGSDRHEITAVTGRAVTRSRLSRDGPSRDNPSRYPGPAVTSPPSKRLVRCYVLWWRPRSFKFECYIDCVIKWKAKHVFATFTEAPGGVVSKAAEFCLERAICSPGLSDRGCSD